MIHSETLTVELEQDEKVDTVVAGLRYTGTDSVHSPSRPRRQGGWPGRASFQSGPITEQADDGTVLDRDPGPVQIGIIPDRLDEEYVEGGTLTGLESLSDFEVVYDPAELAEAMLDSNYLPPIIFGGPETAPEYEVRQRVFDALGLDDSLGTAASPDAERRIREELADVAGIDVDETEPPDQSRETEYKNEFTRSDLYSAVQDLGHDVEWATATKTDMAETLAQESPADVRAVLPED